MTNTYLVPRHGNRIASASLAMLVFGCKTPEAIITELDPESPHSEVLENCEPLESPLRGRQGVAPAITGLCSVDPDGRKLDYRWSIQDLPTGSHTTIHDRHLPTPTLVPDVAGWYLLRLVVSAGHSKSDPAELEILVDDCGKRPPEAVALASNDSPSVGETVLLTASVTDSDTEEGCLAHDPDFTYGWEFDEVPSGSRVAFNDPTLVDPWFAPDLPGTYQISLVVTDPSGYESSPVRLSVEATACGSHTPEVAIASSTAAPATGQSVALSATVTDLDSQPGCEAHGAWFSYDWTFRAVPQDSEVALNDAHLVNPSFVPDMPGTYELEVQVVDPTGRSSTSAPFTIQASTCGSNAPEVSATSNPAAASIGSAIGLLASGTDADNDLECGLDQELSYKWHFKSVPAGSSVSLSSEDGTDVAFRPDVAGTFSAEVVATDSTGRSSAPGTVDVVIDACGTAAPVGIANKSGPGGSVSCDASAIGLDLGGDDQIKLDASPSYDPDNDPAACDLNQNLFYQWTIMETPLDGGGSRIRLPEAQTTILDVSQDGRYRVRLLVTDDTGRTSRATECTLDISNSNN